MVQDYRGHYAYDKVSITLHAPDKIGVYYCGYVNQASQLVPSYIGRAKGENVSIRSRLLDHLRDDRWSDVTHFGFQVCDTQKEAEDWEAAEIAKYKPKHNDIGK